MDARQFWQERILCLEENGFTEASRYSFAKQVRINNLEGYMKTCFDISDEDEINIMKKVFSFHSLVNQTIYLPIFNMKYLDNFAELCKFVMLLSHKIKTEFDYYSFMLEGDFSKEIENMRTGVCFAKRRSTNRIISLEINKENVFVFVGDDKIFESSWYPNFLSNIEEECEKIIDLLRKEIAKDENHSWLR